MATLVSPPVALHQVITAMNRCSVVGPQINPFLLDGTRAERGGSAVGTWGELDAWVNASPLQKSLASRQASPETVIALGAYNSVLGEDHRL